MSALSNVCISMERQIYALAAQGLAANADLDPSPVLRCEVRPKWKLPK